MRMRVFSVIAALSVIPAIAFAGQGRNPPWFPSLMAFEHYDSARTHLFSRANFNGSFVRGNVVNVRVSPGDYLTPYNVVYLSAGLMFVYGGGYGDKGGTGAFVARVDPSTLRTVWYNQLINTVEANGGLSGRRERLAGRPPVRNLRLPAGQARSPGRARGRRTGGTAYAGRSA